MDGHRQEGSGLYSVRDPCSLRMQVSHTIAVHYDKCFISRDKIGTNCGVNMAELANRYEDLKEKKVRKEGMINVLKDYFLVGGECRSICHVGLVGKYLILEIRG